ncbi:uncharacterized protein LOC124522020 isoform X2 [Lynx rufus]|uniref:uncharacterized protein LOC124522020 isoform X2 n=1 Tax=Lynx rufus TaxID=61384 RepID=UPI001F128322|nr:uncharacterized protein LOC124522020 isoform X2 [Lynx rufus]
MRNQAWLAGAVVFLKSPKDEVTRPREVNTSPKIPSRGRRHTYLTSSRKPSMPAALPQLLHHLGAQGHIPRARLSSNTTQGGDVPEPNYPLTMDALLSDEASYLLSTYYVWTLRPCSFANYLRSAYYVLNAEAVGIRLPSVCGTPTMRQAFGMPR